MKRLLAFLVVALLLVACGRSPTHRLGITAAPIQPTLVVVVPMLTLPSDAMAASASDLVPSLGEPIVLGRGQIADAVFAPDASAVAIGWANGVSLWTVADATEQWWRATEVPMLAVDIHPDGSSIAAALANGSLLILDAVTGSPKRYEGAKPLVAGWRDDRLSVHRPFAWRSDLLA